MSHTTISIIIVSYNSRDVIDNCLQSIIRNNDIGDRLEIIVVEQSSEDALFQELSGKYPDITVIRAENRGFGAGNNRGAEIAKGEILFFLNPDTVIEEPLFAFICDQFQKDENQGLIGLRVLSENGDTISYNMLFPFGLISKVKYEAYRKANRFDETQMYIEGADLIIPKDVFQKVNGFDENIFMYCEEMDLCCRIREAGYTIRYHGEKTIRHLQGKCTADRYPEVFGKQLDSFLYVCRKHGFDAMKWLHREKRYQKFRTAIMQILGKKKEAELSKELAGIAASRMQMKQGPA